MTRMYAYADVDEGDVTKVVPDLQARIRVNALGDDVKLTGKVVDVGNRAQQLAGQETKSFRVRILLTPKDERLRPGMSASVDIETRSTEATAVRVPLMAILHKPRKDVFGDGPAVDHSAPASSTKSPARSLDEVDFAWVVKDDKVEPRLVTLGVSDGEHVQVVTGLSTDEWVILGPYRVLEQLKKGDKVRSTRREPTRDVAAVGSSSP
jgi:HlyD family secretion protein